MHFASCPNLGVQAALTYNSRLQLASIAYSNSGGSIFSQTYGYGTANNGQIKSITDNNDSTKSATYTYDPWARLKTAATGQWGLSFTYDRFGNRTQQNVTAGSGVPSNSLTISPTTNRVTGASYDSAGNMTNDGQNTLVYDAENHVTSATNGSSSGTYTLDGSGLRVKKVSGSTTTVYIFSGSKVIAEYDNGAAVTSPSREYIYAGSQLVAKIEAGATNYFHPDHLSARANTDSSGNVSRTFGQYPFGEVWYETGTANKWKFTTYERDAESGNDYAMARSYINRYARFSSTDPLSGSIADPQSLNRYSYTRNDPINMVDPSGAAQCFITYELTKYTFGTKDNPVIYRAISNIQVVYCWGFGQGGFFGNGARGGGGGGAKGPPGIHFSRQAYEDCAKSAFGSDSGTIPGTNKSVPGYEAASDVYLAASLTGADAGLVGTTMAIESNSNLAVRNGNRNADGSVDVGPMQLNSFNKTNPFDFKKLIHGNPFGTNFSPGGRFNGDVLDNIITGANYLHYLGSDYDRYLNSNGDPTRRSLVQQMLPMMEKFFDCLYHHSN